MAFIRKAGLMTHNVVCFGDSITYGQISASYVDLLSDRMGTEGFQFLNGGVNSDLAFNLLRRMEHGISTCPSFATILIGTNDVIATLSPAAELAYRVNKRLPVKPDLEWFLVNLLKIIQRVKTCTRAKIALASIPVLGEDLDSLPNTRVREYNVMVKAVAEKEQIAYLGVYERQAAYLENFGKLAWRAYDGTAALTAQLAVSHFFLRESFDNFSHRKGFALLTDGIHMNNQGAVLIADEIEAWLRANLRFPES
jgi:lysophospholipase L1-like esterase